ncbi:MAG: metalloregulator ArsR/SmtB family transcription factor [Aestuariivirga sp.]
MQTAAETRLDKVFQALSDSTRRSILRRISRRELTVSEIARPYELTFAAVSKHLKVLQQARLIDRRKDGSFQMISLNPEAMKSADQWLRFYQQFWTTRLETLKSLLEDEEKP